MDLKIRKNLSIPSAEISYTASRSSGSGGQHANKADTRITLHWDLENTGVLGPIQKKRVYKNLATYINDEGILKLSCDSNRSQNRNKGEVQDRFCNLILSALRVPKYRKKTKPSRRVKERRSTHIKQYRGRIPKLWTRYLVDQEAKPN